MNLFLGEKENTKQLALEKKLILSRLAACFLALILMNISHFSFDKDLYIFIVLIYMVYNLGLWCFIRNKSESSLFVLSVYIDIIVISALTSIQGRVHSDLYAAYFVVLAYTLAKRQKYLVISTSVMILICYSAACLLFTDGSSTLYNYILSRLTIRMTIMCAAVYVLYNIKTEMNYIGMLNEKAYEMALIDPLTKVYNRNMLDTLMEYRKTNPYSISFAMIDIDDFKSINDTFGHQKGDTILNCLGDLIKRNIRADDICIRYGGEEFLLAFQNTDDETAAKILNRIRTAFAEHTFYCDERQLKCTISAGLAFGEEVLDSHLIIDHADTALYQAKRNGKNNIVVYCTT